MTTVETDATIDATELAPIDAYWRAANYLSVGQIYLLDNPLLREPLRLEHVKPRLLGHWGTTPGPELRLRAPEPRRSASATSTRSTSPARATAGPALVANAYLEGTYSEVYPHIGRDEDGHAAAVPPVLVPRRHPEPRRARDAGLDPRGRRARLRARRTPTARRSTTRTCSSAASSATARPRPARSPRAGTRTSSSNPARDGAVLPILHLNGYKIANPTVLARIPRRRAARAAARATATSRCFVEGDDPAAMHQLMAATLDDGRSTRSAAIQADARASGVHRRGRAGR